MKWLRRRSGQPDFRRWPLACDRVDEGITRRCDGRGDDVNLHTMWIELRRIVDRAGADTETLVEPASTLELPVGVDGISIFVEIARDCDTNPHFHPTHIEHLVP